MPRLPIPDDWNGEFECVQIQWPSSPKWMALLAGFIISPSRGWYWDERTGSVKGAQQIGFQIDALNIPFVSCGGDAVQIDKEYITRYVESAESDFLMSLCGVNPKAFKIENGSLWVKDFCGDWVEIGALTNDVIPTDDPVVYPPEIDGGGYSACGKATAVMELVNQVVSSVYDEADNSFWTWWSHVKSDCPGIGLDAKWIVVACQGAQDLALASLADPTYRPDPFDTSTWQSVKCALARDFSDALPETLNGNDIRSKLQSYFASEWGFDILVNAMFVDALRGINRETFEEFALMGAGYDEGDCDCPETFNYSGAVTWENARTITVESQGATLHLSERIDLRVMEHTIQGGVNENYQEVHWDEKFVATGTIQELQIEFPLMSAAITGFYPAYNWADDNPTPSSNYMQTHVASPTPDSVEYYPQPNKQVVICKWNTPVNLDAYALQYQVKINPKDQDPTRQVWVFRAEIVYAGDLR